jgi:hypothetical protein
LPEPGSATAGFCRFPISEGRVSVRTGRCQNCPRWVSLHRDHSGKIQEVRQRE